MFSTFQVLIIRAINLLIVVALLGTPFPPNIKYSTTNARSDNEALSSTIEASPSSPSSLINQTTFDVKKVMEPSVGGAGSTPAGTAENSQPKYNTTSVERSLDPLQRIGLLAQTQQLDYTSYVYSHSDILLFGYESGTHIEVYRSSGSLLWSGTLDAGDHRSLTPGAGVYLVGASKPFAINVGDALTDYVWGYYAVDQYGKGLSTKFHTYQAHWIDASHDPNFVIFAYENNTQVELRNSLTNQQIWSGYLDDGEHYSNSSLNAVYLTVSSDKPVAALSYTDQGYYVPASNGTFVGEKFHTYVGNSAQPSKYWSEDLNLIAYENSSITVKNSATGSTIWSGNLNAGKVHSISDLNGTYVSVHASGNIAVSVSPFSSYPSGGYYHSIYAQDASGTGIGTNFVVPTIRSGNNISCNMILFAYNDGAIVNVQNHLGTTVWSGILDQAESHSLTPANTVYNVNSSGEVSVLLDCGDHAGAEFAPVHYATVQVDIASPLGGNYYYGSSMLVTADVSLQNTPLLNAVVTGRISLTTGGDYLEFDLNDQGFKGDVFAGDGIYSADITMPGPADMPAGNYYLLISAQKIQDGQLVSGSGATIFSLTGLSGGALDVASNLNCPASPDIFIGDTCDLSVNVIYPDGSIHADGIVKLTVIEPDNREKFVSLENIGNNTWRGNYSFTQSGRHLLDVRATPARATPYIEGYTSMVGDVFNSSFPLTVSVQGLPDIYLQNQLVTFTASVKSGGQPISAATLTAQVNPGQTDIDFIGLGNGLYSGLYTAEEPGDFTIDFQATSPLYKSGVASSTFVISPANVDLLGAVQSTSTATKLHIDFIQDDVQHVAEDGDWFWQKIPQDKFMRNFNFIINVISLGLSANKLSGEWQKAALESTAPVSSRFAGINIFSWMRDQADESIDGRAFRSWATRLETAVQSGLLDDYLQHGQFPPYIGLGVLRRASVYYTAQLVGETMDEVAQDVAGKYLAERRLDNSAFLQNELYPTFVQSAYEDKALVDDYAQAILAAPPLASDQLASSLVQDLNDRRMANFYFMKDINQRNFNLWTARDLREASDNAPWYEKWGLKLWKIATPIVVGVVWGGPVGAVVGVIISVETLIEDWIHDSNNLSLDERMHALAYGSMFTAMETKETLVANSISGLAQVRQGLSPELPAGRIISVNDISRGEDHKLWFSERQAVSSITIRNTGNLTASYNVRAYYDRLSKWGMKFDVFWLDSSRDPATGKAQGWVEIAPGQSKTIEIVFKDVDQNDLDMRPNDGDDITFVLAAVTLNGFYFSESAVHDFAPKRETSTGLDLDKAESLPAIAHPISTQIEKDNLGIEHTIRLNIDNPFPRPVSLKLTQDTPEGLTILSSNGGLIQDDEIQWRRVLDPHDSYEFTYIVSNDSTDRSNITVPAAQLTFYIPEANLDAQFLSVPVTIAAHEVPIIYLPITVSSPQLPVNSLKNGDFEQGGEAGWQEHSSNGWSLVLNTTDLPESTLPHSGSWLAWLGGSDDEISIISQQVTIPASNPFLNYWYMIESEDSCGFDFGGVLVDGNDVVDVFDLCVDENTYGWILRTVNLGAYKGKTVELELRAETDDTNFSSLFVDDVSIGTSVSEYVNHSRLANSHVSKPAILKLENPGNNTKQKTWTPKHQR